MLDDKKNNYDREIVNYHADPFDNRTVAKLSEDIGISRETYYRHMRENKERIFYEADQLRKRYLAELRSNGFKALANQMQKNVKALQMALEITGDYVQKSEQTVNLDPEAKRQKIEAMLAKFKGKRCYPTPKQSEAPTEPKSAGDE